MTKQLTADEIERMGAAATARPWHVTPHHCGCVDKDFKPAKGYDVREATPLGDMECPAMTKGNATFITALANHSAEWSAALRENERLREALKPFAAICPGGLKDVGGGTLVKPSIKIQLIKNAREALGDSHE